jgi:outer membrane receptor protein involved in Fe transport
MDKTSLPNQSKNMWNLIVFYEKYGVSLRLAGNFRGKSVETIQQQLGNDFYIWSDNNFTLDLSASWSITPKLKTFVELNNLTNSYIGLYMGNNKDRITSREWYSMRGQAGIKLDIF